MEENLEGWGELSSFERALHKAATSKDLKGELRYSNVNLSEFKYFMTRKIVDYNQVSFTHFMCTVTKFGAELLMKALTDDDLRVGRFVADLRDYLQGLEKKYQIFSLDLLRFPTAFLLYRKPSVKAHVIMYDWVSGEFGKIKDKAGISFTEAVELSFDFCFMKSTDYVSDGVKAKSGEEVTRFMEWLRERNERLIGIEAALWEIGLLKNVPSAPRYKL